MENLPTTCYLDGAGRKRKAPGKNSSESSSQLEETTDGDKTQQVNVGLSALASLLNVAVLEMCCRCTEGASRKRERKGGPAVRQPGVLQTVLQRAGHGGA